MSHSTSISIDSIANPPDSVSSDTTCVGFVQRSRRVIRDVRWVWRDGFRQFTSPSVVVLISMIAGLVTGAAALGGVITVAQALGADAPPRVAGMVMDVRTTSGFLAALIVIAALGLTSAGLLYVAEHKLNRLTRNYERMLVDRVVAAASQQSAASGDSSARSTLKQIVGRLSRIGARWTAFAYRDLLRSVLYAAMSILAITAMILFEPLLTLMLAPIALAYVIPLYRVNRGVAQCQHRYAAAIAPARKRFNRVVNAAIDTKHGPPAEDGQDSARRELHNAQELFYQRMLFNQRTTFVNAAFFIVSLLVLLVYFGLTAIDEPAWARILGYLIALRFAWSGLRQSSAMLTKVSRFLPEFERYAAFVEGRLAIPDDASISATLEPAPTDEDEELEE